MTAQEVFYYTVSLCSWIFILMMVVIFYRINRCISQWKKVVDKLESTAESSTFKFFGAITGIIINLFRAFRTSRTDKSRLVPTKGGEKR